MRRPHRPGLGARLELERLLPVGGPLHPPLLREMDFLQQPIAFLLTQESATGGVFHQLVRVCDIEFGQSGRGADDAAQRIGHRAPQDVGDPGQRLQQGRDLRTAKF